jgi:hypothetical protein
MTEKIEQSKLTKRAEKMIGVSDATTNRKVVIGKPSQLKDRQREA